MPSKLTPLAFIFIITLFPLLPACNGLRDLADPESGGPAQTRVLPPSPQNWSGDPEKGFEYLVYGDYIGTGIPFSFLEKRLSGARDTVWNRTGNAGLLSYPFNAFSAYNGVEVVAGNCFTCHTSRMEGQLVPGLGNVESDFQKSIKFTATLTNVLVRQKYGRKSEEFKAFKEFGYFYKAIAPKIVTKNPGVNPAFRLEEACVNYRNPADLSMQKHRNFKTPAYSLAADVPPLWNIAKKNALYYNGMGRGDFSKLLMQASVLGIPDSTHARKVQRHFVDVVAWAAQLQPPPYPRAVDPVLVAKGKVLFEENCSRCHGAYGAKETYPNKLVSLDEVGTDPYYARYFSRVSGLGHWYNQSWFANTSPASRMEPSEGYVAPPLDGVWATAPYLHNGSVPSLDALLHSTTRPAKWKRMDEYDHENMGWKYEESGKGRYDTSLPGYGNKGHYFGDHLSAEERKAVIEYLKTL